jgi:hypothetical protein
MSTLRAYNFLGQRLGTVTTDDFHVWSCLADTLADRFAVEVDLIHVDDDEDGVEYITVDGHRVGYVVTVDREGRESGHPDLRPVALQAAE